jgi:L-lactate dehydrogenase complex protein LldG
MGSREKILENIAGIQATEKPLPDLKRESTTSGDYANEFITVLEKIGGKVVEINTWSSLTEYVLQHYPKGSRILSTHTELSWFTSQFSSDAHSFENVELAILKGNFGVAENGAIWITDNLMGDRSIPFISQHLALVINKNDIVPTLHEAYERIASDDYNFGTFIAGPSKTADIEQSLVLGAHGPKSLVVFLRSE